MTDLRKLIEAVEAGEWDGSWRGLIDSGIPSPSLFSTAYHGSLDAALALHEALLPGWGWRKNHWDGDKPEYETIWVTMPGNWRTGYTHNYTDKTHARAWLLAILKAYEAQQ